MDRHPGDSFALRDDYRAYVCELRTRRVRAVGTFERSETSAVGAYRPIASGRFVAFDLVDCDRTGCEGGGVRVLDTRTGRRRASAATPGNAEPVSALVLKANGSAAWIRPFTGSSTEVRKLDRTGEVVLDAAAGVERGSLALSSSTVYWTRDAAPRAAAID
jgi:hypothetical protein